MRPWVSTVMGKCSHFLLREQNLAATTCCSPGTRAVAGVGRPEKPGVPSPRGEGRVSAHGLQPTLTSPFSMPHAHCLALVCCHGVCVRPAVLAWVGGHGLKPSVWSLGEEPLEMGTLRARAGLEPGLLPPDNSSERSPLGSPGHGPSPSGPLLTRALT